jgi:hypothetical protein
VAGVFSPCRSCAAEKEFDVRALARELKYTNFAGHCVDSLTVYQIPSGAVLNHTNKLDTRRLNRGLRCKTTHAPDALPLFKLEPRYI